MPAKTKGTTEQESVIRPFSVGQRSLLDEILDWRIDDIGLLDLVYAEEMMQQEMNGNAECPIQSSPHDGAFIP